MTLIKDLSDNALLKERDEWDRRIKDAQSWGASVAAAIEFKRECEEEMRRRGK